MSSSSAAVLLFLLSSSIDLSLSQDTVALVIGGEYEPEGGVAENVQIVRRKKQLD